MKLKHTWKEALWNLRQNTSRAYCRRF